jgi:hypothetical protein
MFIISLYEIFILSLCSIIIDSGSVSKYNEIIFYEFHSFVDRRVAYRTVVSEEGHGNGTL